MKKVMQILDSTIFCTLSTVRDDGSPWASPVFFVFDESHNIYWWTDLESVHSQNIDRDNRVFITVFNPYASEKDAAGVYMQAKARIIKDKKELTNAITLYNKRAKLFQLTEEITTGAAPTRIFAASAERIWLNSEGKKNGYYIDTRSEVQL